MGLFSKEACVLCGKEVGFTNRVKIKGGEYVCNDCVKKTSPFIRLRDLDASQVKDLIAQIEADAALKEFTGVSQASFSMAGETYYFYIDKGSPHGYFKIINSKSKKYAHQPAFRAVLVHEYERQFSFEDIDYSKIPQDFGRVISLNKRKGADDKLSYEITIPYCDELVKELTIEIGSNAKEADVDQFYSRMIKGFDEWRAGLRSLRRDQIDAHNLNMAKTASELLKDKIKGEDHTDEIMARAIERNEDIAEGKVRRGLFGGFKKKK